MKKTERVFSKRYGKLLALSFVIFCFSYSPAGAQSFTQQVQQNSGGGGRVVIHQDSSIDDLVNGKVHAPVQQPTRPAQNTGNGQTRRQQTTGDDSQHRGENREQRRTDSTDMTTTQPTAIPDSTVQTPRLTRKVNGYRIQPFVGGKTRADRVKAEQAGSTLQSLFPQHRVYVHFLAGRWTCRMGDFRTIDEAREVLNEVVKMGYDTAILVRGKVNVPY